LLGTGLKCNESQCGGGGFSIDNKRKWIKERKLRMNPPPLGAVLCI